MIQPLASQARKTYIGRMEAPLDLELTVRNKITGEERHVLVNEVPDEVTQGELKGFFALYGGPDSELTGFAKVEVIPMEEGRV